MWPEASEEHCALYVLLASSPAVQERVVIHFCAKSENQGGAKHCLTASLRIIYSYHGLKPMRTYAAVATGPKCCQNCHVLQLPALPASTGIGTFSEVKEGSGQCRVEVCCSVPHYPETWNRVRNGGLFLQQSDECAMLCCMQRQKEIVKISVGAQAVNELLGGGIESRCITEVYGEFR